MRTPERERSPAEVYEDAAAPFLLAEAEEIRGLVVGAGFDDVHVESRSFDARLPAGDDLVADVSRDTEDLLERHRRGAEIVVPMHVNLAAATAAA